MSRDIPVGQIHPNPDQPRKHFAGIDELAASLRDEGQQTPLLVRPVGEEFQIVQGERRWRAAQVAGLKTLRCEVREATDEEAFRLALIENLQRDNLSPVEEAEAFRKLLDGGMTQAQVGAVIGKTQSYVAQKLRLLNAPEPVRVLVAQGALTEGHVRQLLRLERLYPASAVYDNPDGWEDGGPDLSGPEKLWQLHTVLRPEQHPPGWPLHPNDLSACGHLPVLEESARALCTAIVDGGGALPQWIIAAWWWGFAFAVWGFPVDALGNALNQWYDRYSGAVVYCYDKGKCKMPVRRGLREGGELPLGLVEHGQDLYAEAWARWCDLRHSSSLRLTREDVCPFYWRLLDVGSVVNPSALQEWGSQAERGRRILAYGTGAVIGGRP